MIGGEVSGALGAALGLAVRTATAFDLLGAGDHRLFVGTGRLDARRLLARVELPVLASDGYQLVNMTN